MTQTQLLSLPLAIKTLIPSRYRLQMLLLLGTFAGSWASIFGRIAQNEGVSTPVIIASRMTLGALFMTPLIWQNYRTELSNLSRRDLLLTMMTGFWFAIHLLAGFEGLQHTSVLVSNVIGGTLPIWVALLEVYFLHVRLGRIVWIALSITLLGGIIIASTGNQTLGDNPTLGTVLALIAAITGALYAVLGRGSRGKISFLPYMWLLFVFGSITSLVAVRYTGGTFTGHTTTGYLAVIMLTLLAQIIGHTIYNYVLRQLPATFVSVSGQIGTVIGAILAFLIFREIPGPWQIIGSVIIITGILLITLNQPKSRNTVRTPEVVYPIPD